MAPETVPADIAAAIAAYGDAMRQLAGKNARGPQATVSRNIAKNAREDLEAAILAHLRNAGEMEQELEELRTLTNGLDLRD